MSDPEKQIQKGSTSNATNQAQQETKGTQLETIFKWIFVVFLALHIGVIVFAFLNGNPSSLTQPYDSDHRPCGVGELADYPYIYFTAPTDKTLWKTVCVKQCPPEDQKRDSSKRTLVYESSEFQGIVCLPKSIKYYQAIAPSLDVEGLIQTVGDIQKSKYVILGSVVATVFFIFLYAKVQSRHGKRGKDDQIISSQSVFSAQVICNLLILIALAVFALLNATKEEKTLELTDDQVTVEDADQLKEIQQSKTHDPIWFWLALVVSGSFIFYYLYSLFPILWEKKQRENFFTDLDKLSKISYDFFEDESIDIEQLPLFQAITSIVYIGLWLYTALELYSCGEVVHEEKSLPFGQFKFDEATKYIAIFHIFSLVWVMTFIINIGKLYLIESSDAFYKKKTNPKKDSTLGTWFSISQSRFHIGSIALMSLIQLTVGVLQYLPFVSQFSFYNKIASARKETLFYLLSSNVGTFQSIVDSKNTVSTDKLSLANNTTKNFFEAGEECLTDLGVSQAELQKNNQPQTTNTNSSNQAQPPVTFKQAYEQSEKYGDFLQFTVSLWISLLITFICFWILKSDETINSPVISLGIIFAFSIVVSNIIMGVIGASIDQFLLTFFHVNQKKTTVSKAEDYPDAVKGYYDKLRQASQQEAAQKK